MNRSSWIRTDGWEDEFYFRIEKSAVEKAQQVELKMIRNPLGNRKITLFLESSQEVLAIGKERMETYELLGCGS